MTVGHVNEAVLLSPRLHRRPLAKPSEDDCILRRQAAQRLRGEKLTVLEPVEAELHSDTVHALLGIVAGNVPDDEVVGGREIILHRQGLLGVCYHPVLFVGKVPGPSTDCVSSEGNDALSRSMVSSKLLSSSPRCLRGWRPASKTMKSPQAPS